jgi:hypothetical protein
VKHSSTALSWTVLSKALDLQQDATAVLEDWAGKPVPEALVPLVLRLFKQRPGEAVQAQMKQVACKALGAVASSLPFEAIRFVGRSIGSWLDVTEGLLDCLSCPACC